MNQVLRNALRVIVADAAQSLDYEGRINASLVLAWFDSASDEDLHRLVQAVGELMVATRVYG